MNINFVLLVALPARSDAVTGLASQSIIQETVRENQLPPLKFQSAEQQPDETYILKRILDPKGNSAGFAAQSVPHIVLAEKFFSTSEDRQLFQLIHELRHAHQHIRSPQWARYLSQRQDVWMRCSNNDNRLWKFFSPPLEVDAQFEALYRLPITGADIVLEQIEEIQRNVVSFRGNRAHTREVCLDLLPRMYEWKRIKDNSVLAVKELEICRVLEDFYRFLQERTLFGNNVALRNMCREYLNAERSGFLMKAEPLWQYLCNFSS